MEATAVASGTAVTMEDIAVHTEGNSLDLEELKRHRPGMKAAAGVVQEDIAVRRFGMMRREAAGYYVAGIGHAGGID